MVLANIECFEGIETPELIQIGAAPSKQARMFDNIIALIGGSGVGKSYIGHRLVRFRPGHYRPIRKACCEGELRDGKPRDDVDIYEARRFQRLIGCRRSLSTFITSAHLQAALGMAEGTFPDEEHYSHLVSEMFLATFFTRELEKTIEKAIQDGAKLIVELRPQDYWGWKKAFPRTHFFWITADPAVVIERYEKRRYQALPQTEREKVYREIRLAESLALLEAPPQLPLYGAVNRRPLVNNTEEEGIRNSHAIHNWAKHEIL